MSQKSSLPQVTRYVSRALMQDRKTSLKEPIDRVITLAFFTESHGTGGTMFLVYDNAQKVLRAYENTGQLIKEWRATNYAQSSSAGPWPAGVFSFDKFIASPAGATINSSYGKDGKLQFSDVPYYEKLSQSVVVEGQATFTVDNDSTGSRTGMQIHSGQANSKFGDGNHPTNGCIRVTATAMQELVSLVTEKGLSDLMVSTTPVSEVLVDALGSNLNELIRVTSSTSVSAGAGSDVILGVGASAFSLSGDAGNDTVIGGRRADTLTGGLDADIIRGLGGDDTIYCGRVFDEPGPGDIATGGAGVDTIFGSRGKDFLYGGDGADRINGGGGSDLICGDGTDRNYDSSTGLWKLTTPNPKWDLRLQRVEPTGNDTLNGGFGNDVIYGGSGIDTLNGGADNVS